MKHTSRTCIIAPHQNLGTPRQHLQNASTALGPFFQFSACKYLLKCDPIYMPIIPLRNISIWHIHGGGNIKGTVLPSFLLPFLTRRHFIQYLFSFLSIPIRTLGLRPFCWLLWKYIYRIAPVVYIFLSCFVFGRKHCLVPYVHTAWRQPTEKLRTLFKIKTNKQSPTTHHYPFLNHKANQLFFPIFYFAKE